MKKYIIDLCCVEEKDMVREEIKSNDELSINEMINEMFECSIDDLWFSKKDVDKRYYVLLDGGEMIKLKNGKYVNICYR